MLICVYTCGANVSTLYTHFSLMLLFIASLFLFPQKGELDSVKVLVAFGASVNTTNYRGQTPLDLATMGYLHQERKLSLTNAALNRHLVRQRRESSLKLPNQRPAPPTHTHKDSPLLSHATEICRHELGQYCVCTIRIFYVNTVHCFFIQSNIAQRQL